MKASVFFEDTLRGNAIFRYQDRVGTTAAWMLRNVTPTVTRTPPRGLRQHKRFCYRLLRFTERSIILTKEHVCRHMLHLDEIAQCGGCTTLLHNPFAAAHGYNCLDAWKRNSNGNADASKGSTDASKSASPRKS